MIEEVIVTAQRRSEAAQDVPMALSAFTGEQLALAGVDNTQKLENVTPSFSFIRSGYGVQPSIRGLGTRGVDAGDEAVVPMFVDGAYQTHLQSGMMNLPDVERLEVLRGPQVALYGRNAVGGAVNVVTRSPSADERAEFEAGYGRFNEYTLSTFLTGGTETLAASLALFRNKDDGYVRDIVNNRKVAVLNNSSGRAKVKFTPSDVFDLTLAASYSHAFDDYPNATQPLNGNTSGRRLNPNTVIANAPWTIATSRPASLKVLNNTSSLVANWDIGIGQLTGLASYAYTRLGSIQDSDASPPEAQFTPGTRQTGRSLYYETYLASASNDKFEWVVGGTYFSDLSKADPARSESSNLTAGANFGLITRTDNWGKIKTEAYAVYAQASYHFTDELTLELGGRYSSETKELVSRQLVTNTRTGVATAASFAPRDATWKRFTPSGTLTYKPNDQTNLYARASQGFKSGIFAATAPTNPPVDPVIVTQYEVGAKLDPRPWLRTNFSAYFTKVDGDQIRARDPITNTGLLINAAKEEIYGLEAEILVRPTADLNLRASIWYLHGEYTSFPGAQYTFPQTVVNPNPATACEIGTGALQGGNRQVFCDATGNKLIRAPNFSSSFGGDYTMPLGDGELVFAGGVRYTGKAYSDPANRLAYDAYWDVNGQISWSPTDQRFAVTLWGDNLTNEFRYTSVLGSGSGDVAAPARPRTYGVRLRYVFD